MKYPASCGAMLCALLMIAAAGAPASQTMYVQVRSSALRATPSPFGAVLAEAAYGDSVTVLENRAGWSRVERQDASAWIHDSALTRKRIVLKPGAEDVQRAASGEELSLAGKGFNAQVESEFRAKNPEANFAVVDQLEKKEVSPREIQNFFEKGGVSPQGGAR